MKSNKIKLKKLISFVITTSIIGTSILAFNFNANAADESTSTTAATSTQSTTTNTSTSNTESEINLPILKNGSTGQYVYLLQSYLNIIKAYNTKLPSDFSQLQVDGVFGNNTLNDVKIYQQYKNLTVDGIVGQQTWDSLHSDIGY